MKDKRKSAKSTAAGAKASEVFTDEERAAMKDAFQERTARRGSRADKTDEEDGDRKSVV